MRLSEIINEVFDSPVNGKITQQTNNKFVTQATIGNRDIKFSALAEDEGNWSIDFIEKTKDKGFTFGKSGSGNELQVFSFVIESLKLFISIYSPNTISFTSDLSDVNRSKLYSAIGRKVKIPGYHLEKIENSSGYDLFMIVKDSIG